MPGQVSLCRVSAWWLDRTATATHAQASDPLRPLCCLSPLTGGRALRCCCVCTKKWKTNGKKRTHPHIHTRTHRRHAPSRVASETAECACLPACLRGRGVKPLALPLHSGPLRVIIRCCGQTRKLEHTLRRRTPHSHNAMDNPNDSFLVVDTSSGDRSGGQRAVVAGAAFTAGAPSVAGSLVYGRLDGEWGGVSRNTERLTDSTTWTHTMLEFVVMGVTVEGQQHGVITGQGFSLWVSGLPAVHRGTV